MKDFEKALVITHFASRSIPPYDAIEGPANSVCRALKTRFPSIGFLQLPLVGFNRPIIRGHFDDPRETKIPSFLGQVAPLKYLVDGLLVAYCIAHYSWVNRGKRKLIIGVDPLSCLPLVFFKFIFGYSLVFYSVDFNHRRFSSRVLQGMYEFANRISSRGSDQVWVVSEALQKYQNDAYSIKAFHISNAPIFSEAAFQKGMLLRNGRKLAWTGSFMTKRQFDIFFTFLKKLQNIRPEMEMFLVPISDHQKFEACIREYYKRQTTVLKMYSRSEWQVFVASCDLGIAIYDDQFGQTRFAEPLKMWDYLMCGVPFIISQEPSIPRAVRESGAAYILGPGNTIPDEETLRSFLRPDNLKSLESVCLELAERSSIDKAINEALLTIRPA